MEDGAEDMDEAEKVAHNNVSLEEDQQQQEDLDEQGATEEADAEEACGSLHCEEGEQGEQEDQRQETQDHDTEKEHEYGDRPADQEEHLGRPEDAQQIRKRAPKQPKDEPVDAVAGNKGKKEKRKKGGITVIAEDKENGRGSKRWAPPRKYTSWDAVPMNAGKSYDEKQVMEAIRKTPPKHDYFGHIFSSQSQRPFSNYFLPTIPQPPARQHIQIVRACLPPDAVSHSACAPANLMPLSTIKVQWRSRQNYTVYTPEGVYAYLSSFGDVDFVYLQSPNSVLVVFATLAAAYNAVKCPTLGAPWDPLMATWLEKRMNNHGFYRKYAELEMEALGACALANNPMSTSTANSKPSSGTGAKAPTSATEPMNTPTFSGEAEVTSFAVEEKALTSVAAEA